MFQRVLCSIALLVAVIGFAPAASADQFGGYHVYVAATGSDNNDCLSVTTACKSLYSALTKVSSGGTIVCDGPISNEFTVIITVSATIDCKDDALETIKINVPASDSHQSVHLRGFILNSADSYGAEIEIVAGTTVVLEDLIVARSSTQGVWDHRASPGKLTIKDSIFDRNQGPGVVVSGTGIVATLDNVTLSNNSYGVAIAAGNSASIIRSTVSGNSAAGVEADGGSLVIVDGSTISNNNVGIQSGSAIRLSNNNVMFNTTGVSGPTGSFGNNRFSGNGSDGTVLTPVGASSTDLAQK